MTEQEIDQFRQSLAKIEAAFIDWAELKGFKDADAYEFESIDADGITFSYIEWGYEPRYDGWEHHSKTMPLAFLTDRDSVAVAIRRERAQEERQQAVVEAAKTERRRRDTEVKERATLAKLQARYGEAD